MASTNPSVMTYVGHGQQGVWSDPSNWSKGMVPNAADTAVFNSSATLNGAIDVFNLMLLGNEAIAVNGQVKTENTNVCQSFMVCEGAVATFNAGSSLADAGGLVCGIDASGTVIVNGAAGGHAAAVLDVVNMKIGQADGGVGVLTVAGGIVNDSGLGFIGLAGQGTLNVSGNGQANYNNLVVGNETGAVGAVNIAGSGTVSVAGATIIGAALAGAPGGTAVATISGGGAFESDRGYSVGAGSAVQMAGGKLIAGPDGQGITINQGGMVSGFGTVNATTRGIADNGTLASSGGTLIVTGNLSGMGAIQIGAGSTLDLVASKITAPSLSFLGANGTLELAAGVKTAATISGFALGDHIDMAGIDSVSWNGAAGVLTLSEKGSVLDRLTFTGIGAGNSFSVTQTAGIGVISMHALPSTTALILPSHH